MLGPEAERRRLFGAHAQFQVVRPDIAKQKLHQPGQTVIVVTAGQEFAKLPLVQPCDHDGELAAA
ncbi:hypothetical protein D3C76_1794990 [compost metagenome]